MTAIYAVTEAKLRRYRKMLPIEIALDYTQRYQSHVVCFSGETMHTITSITVFLAGLILTWQAIPATGQTPDSNLLKDFDATKDAALFGKFFQPHGVRTGRSVTTEPGGGIVLDLGPQKEAGHVGMRANASLGSNFLIEVKYDIQAIPDGFDSGYGVSFGISTHIDYKVGGASLTRGVSQKNGQRYTAGRDIPKGDGKTQYASVWFPTESRHGRLALRRVRSGEVQMLAADTPDGQLLLLQRYPFPDQPVQSVGLFGDTGGAGVELRVRLYDLRVLTGSAVPTEDAPRGPTGTTNVPLPPTAAVLDPVAVEATDIPIQPTQPRTMWWAPIITFVLGLILGLSLRGRKKSNDTQQAEKP